MSSGETLIKMKEEERIAKLAVEAVIPRAEMRFCEDQSKCLHDFDLCLPNGEIAALEVTTSTIQMLRDTIGAIGNSYFVSTRSCRKDWSVHPRSGALIKKIRSCVDRYLADLEAAGLDCFIGPTDCARYPAVERIYRDLAIEAGAVTAWKKRGKIVIWPPHGGEYTGKHVQTAVQREASKADNKKKLGRSCCRERHLFVYVDPRAYPTWKSLLDEHPPVEAPILPNEISHVWVVSHARIPDHFLVWRGSVDSGWSKPGLLRVQIPLA